MSASRRVRIDLAYDGTPFAGWQVQPERPTVQGTLEDALARLHGGMRIAVRGAGRTDAGVHARGQVADALVSDRFDDGDLSRALRALVPSEIAIVSVRTVPEDFHSRIAATAKTYAYLVDRSPSGNPFLARYALQAPYPVDVAAVEDALRLLPGRHDFSGFCASASEVEDRVRTLTRAERVVLREDLELYRFTAEGFLMHMVRILVGTLLDVGRGRFGPERIGEVLLSGDRARGGTTAPAHGLCLERVDFPSAVGGASGALRSLW
ncbi:MAG TPA: tRNA pseudouridine(38-40) synthase TruA [Candidatus Polarisedimenticolaceae bacterium]|nr:tRNA pseudouridine(38-40) synthase TruA [Candidatus Polarisedimenticolaceae bacterium]